MGGCSGEVGNGMEKRRSGEVGNGMVEDGGALGVVGWWDGRFESWIMDGGLWMVLIAG